MKLLKRESQKPARSPLVQLAVWALTWALIIGFLGALVIGVIGSIDFGHEDPDHPPKTTSVQWSNP